MQLVSFLLCIYRSVCFPTALTATLTSRTFHACVCKCLRVFQLCTVQLGNHGGIWIFHIPGNHIDCHLLRCFYYALHNEVRIQCPLIDFQFSNWNDPSKIVIVLFDPPSRAHGLGFGQNKIVTRQPPPPRKHRENKKVYFDALFCAAMVLYLTFYYLSLNFKESVETTSDGTTEENNTEEGSRNLLSCICFVSNHCLLHQGYHGYHRADRYHGFV